MQNFDEDDELLKSLSIIQPPPIQQKQVASQAITASDVKQYQDMIYKSDKLLENIKHEDMDKIPRELEQLHQLDDQDSVAKIIQQHQNTDTAGALYTSKENQEKLKQLRQQDQLATSDKVLSKTVAYSVTAQRSQASQDEVAKRMANLKINKQDSLAQQLIVGQVPHQEMQDMNDMIKIDVNDQEVIDYDKLHESQVLSIQQLPIKELEQPPFLKEDTRKYEQLGRQQLIESYLKSFPSQTMANINQINKFQIYATQGSAFNYHSQQEIANKIQLDQPVEFHEQNKQNTDFYEHVQEATKQKHRDAVITKDQIQQSDDYEIQPIDIQDALKQLNQPFNPVLQPSLFVDEMAMGANQCGESYKISFQNNEQMLFQRRTQEIELQRSKIIAERQMEHVAKQKLTQEEVQILKSGVEHTKIIEVELESRLQNGQHDCQFILNFYDQYVTSKTDQNSKEKTKHILQNANLMCIKTFQNPNIETEYKKNSSFDESLVDLNITTNFIHVSSPKRNLQFEKFIDSKLDFVQTQLGKRLSDCWAFLHSPLDEQIIIFEIMSRDQEQGSLENNLETCMKVVQLYEKIVDSIKQKYPYDELVKQMRAEFGFSPKIAVNE